MSSKLHPHKQISTVLCLAAGLALFSFVLITRASGVPAVLTLTVTNAADAGPGTLRQAILDAADGDTITFDPTLNGETIVLSTPLPTITKTLIIDGMPTPSLQVSGNNTVRSGLHLDHLGADVTVSSLTFTAGNAGRGGAMYVEEGQLTLSNATISNNTSTIGDGGGFFTDAGGSVTLTNSTVSGNTADSGQGGGFFTDAGGSVTLTNSTVSGNIADNGSGGGFFTEENGTTTLMNSTVSGNTADSGSGSGFYIDEGGTITLNSSIVSGNNALFGDGQEILLNPGSFITTTLNSDGFNIVGADGDSGVVEDEDGGSGIENNLQPGETPNVPLADILNPTLADNGGPTLTHALIPGSPAIDHVPSVLCSGAPVNGVDQRHVARNADGNSSSSANECDVGAFELNAPIEYTVFIYLPIGLR